MTKKYHVSTKTISRIRSGLPAQVPQQPQAAPGEVAAEAFALFNGGRKPTGVVIALKQPPEVVQALYERWVEMRGAWYVSARLRKDLVAAIEANVAEADGMAVVRGPADVLKYFDQVIEERNASSLNVFRYRCDTCNEFLEATPSEEWKWALENLGDGRGHLGGVNGLSSWGHSECHKKK